MWTVLLTTALAQTADPFAGWKGSRWLVELEETLPMQLALAGPSANPPVGRAVQIEAVVSCPEAAPSGKKAMYVTCAITDLAMRVSPQADPGDRAREYASAVQGLVTALKGGALELKVKADGRLQSADIVVPAKTDPLTKIAAEALTVDLFGGFSLFHEDVPAGMKWVEKGSILLRGPTQPAGEGLTKIEHVPTKVDGNELLQSSGGGTFACPYLSWGAGSLDKAVAQVSGTTGESGTMAGGAMTFEPRTFDATFNGVAVVGKQPILFEERIWAVQAAPKPDLTGATGTPLWINGHIRRIGDDVTPVLGRTGLSSAPGATFGDLPAWEPLQTVGG